MGWLQKQMMSGTNPKSILMRIIPSGMTIPEEMDEFEMWSIIAEYLRSIDEPPPRQKLEQYNTFDDAIQLLKTCKNILVLTGAGVSFLIYLLLSRNEITLITFIQLFYHIVKADSFASTNFSGKL